MLSLPTTGIALAAEEFIVTQAENVTIQIPASNPLSFQIGAWEGKEGEKNFDLYHLGNTTANVIASGNLPSKKGRPAFTLSGSENSDTSLILQNVQMSGDKVYSVFSVVKDNGTLDNNKVFIEQNNDLPGLRNIAVTHQISGSASNNALVISDNNQTLASTTAWVSLVQTGEAIHNSLILGNNSKLLRVRAVSLQSGAANENSIVIGEGSEVGEVNTDGKRQGLLQVAYIENADGTAVANKNQLIISAGANVGDAYAAYVKSGGTLTENSIEIKDGASTGNIFGAWSGSNGNTSFNKVSVTKANVGEVQAGASRASGSGEGSIANENVVILNGASASLVYAGNAAQEVKGNVIEAQDTNVEGIPKEDGTITSGIISAGRSSTNGAVLNENRVILNGNVKANYIYGASGSSGTFTANSVISSGDTEAQTSIFGAYASSTDVASSFENNTVQLIGTIKAGRRQISAATGGLVSKAHNNHVYIEGDGAIATNVLAAWSEKNNPDASFENNSVMLKGNIVVGSGIFAARNGEEGVNTGNNSISLEGHILANNMDGYNNLYFHLNESNILTDGGSEHILNFRGDRPILMEGKDIHIYDPNQILNLENDYVTRYGILNIQKKPGTNEWTTFVKVDSKFTLHRKTFEDVVWHLKNDKVGEIYLQGKKLHYVEEGPDNPPSSIIPDGTNNPPPVIIPGDAPDHVVEGKPVANNNADSLSDTRLASIALATQSASFVADEGVAAMRNQMYGRHVFAAGEGGASRYGSGHDHVKLNGGSLITGAMGSYESTLVGGFFEASWGHAAGNRKEYSAKSNLQSYGVGILFSHEFNDHFTMDGSFRVGWMKNKFKGRYFDMGTTADFTSRSPYTSAHVGAKYTYALTDKFDLAFYGRYVATLLASDRIGTGGTSQEKMKAKSTMSHVLTAGVEAGYTFNDNFKVVGELGVAETMGAKARGTIGGLNLRTVSINGTTGIGQLKLQMKPSKASPWKVDVGIKGYVGAREGVIGTGRVTYSF